VGVAVLDAGDQGPRSAARRWSACVGAPLLTHGVLPSPPLPDTGCW